jgi:DNA-binding XRE family transcriptional regulator
MPKTKKFSQLTDAVGRDPIRRARIDAATKRAAQENRAIPFAELRPALGVTQAEMADLTGKSQSAISQIETGEIAPSLDVPRATVTELGGTLEVAAVFDDRRVFLDASGPHRSRRYAGSSRQCSTSCSIAARNSGSTT